MGSTITLKILCLRSMGQQTSCRCGYHARIRNKAAGNDDVALAASFYKAGLEDGSSIGGLPTMEQMTMGSHRHNCPAGLPLMVHTWICDKKSG